MLSSVVCISLVCHRLLFFCFLLFVLLCIYHTPPSRDRSVKWVRLKKERKKQYKKEAQTRSTWYIKCAKKLSETHHAIYDCFITFGLIYVYIWKRENKSLTLNINLLLVTSTRSCRSRRRQDWIQNYNKWCKQLLRVNHICVDLFIQQQKKIKKKRKTDSEKAKRQKIKLLNRK